ncbi:autotransporter domain-containing protein [Variovorax sp. LT2P21]|uniref:autotransporter domain-containing protein n=1 Tax=Variovorax sp. LT2P21 TaxID=3443731 RepID=UPI003F458D56
MNRIYRIVFNRRTNMWQVVSEIARGPCQSARSDLPGAREREPASKALHAVRLTLRTLVAAWGFALAQAALAQVSSSQLPTGGSINGGTGTINGPAGATLAIDQTSSRMSNSWSTFDIGSGARVTFNQPTTSSASFNVVTSGNPTQIFGTLNANGQVLLSNTSAIVFGSTASVNVGGLLATSLGMQTSDFMAGNYALDAGGNTVALVANSGTLNAASGSVILLGGSVVNNGTITATDGNIQLVAADRATLVYESGGFNATVTGALQLALNSTAVTNTSVLSAPGGRISLQARAAQGLFSELIRNSGVITAAGLGSGSDGSVAFIATGASGATAVIDSGQVNVRDGSISFSTDGSVQQTGSYVAGVLEGSIGGNASFTGTNQIAAIGTMDVSGNLVVRNNRNLAQIGSLNVAGTTSIDTGVNAITLDNANNVFGSTVSLVGGNTQIVASNALTLGTLATGNLTASSSGALNLGRGTVTGTLSTTSNGGAITQSASNPLAVSGTSNLDAGAGAITVTTSGNDFLGAVSLTGGNTAIADANTLTLGTLATGNLTATSTGALNLGSGTVTGALSATSNNGAITQSASNPFTVAGTSTLNAGTGAITLTTAGNDFGQAMSLTGGNTAITDANALTLSTLATGNLTLISNGVLNLGTGTVTGTLNATSNGSNIRQSAVDPITVSGISNFNAGSTGNVSLTTNGNDFGQTVNLTGRTAAIVDVNALTLGTLATGNLIAVATGDVNLGHGTVTGALSVYSNGGAITQSASNPLTVTATGYLNAVTGAITLTTAGNDFRQPLTLLSGNAAITDTNALAFDALTTGSLTAISSGALNLGRGTVTGALSATSNGGAISQSTTNPLTVTGTGNLNAGAGSITLEQAGNDFGGAVSLIGSGIRLVDSNDLNVAALTLGSNSALSLIAAGTLSLPASAIDTGSADLTLQSGNALATAAALSGNNVSLRGDNGITLAHNVTADGALTLRAVNSAIVQSAGVLAVNNTSSIDAGNGAIALTGAGNDFGQVVSLTGGSTAITDANALTLGTLATRNLTVISSGALNLGSGTVDGALSGTSNGGAITQTGALTVAGNASLNAGAGIALANAGNDFQGTLSLTGTTVQVADSSNLALGAINASGALTLAVGGTATTTAALTAATVTMDAGMLRMDHALTTSSVQVGRGAAIGGTGTISGAVEVAAGGTLKGTSGQTLTMGSLTLDSGSTFEATLGAPGGAQLVQVNGALTLDGTLNVNDLGGLSAGVYRLIDYTGALIDNGLEIGTTPSGSSLTLQTATAGKVNLANTGGQTLNFWDGNATASADNGVIDGGNGVWTATSTNWTIVNGSVNASMSPTPGFAIFQGTPGTVTVSGAQGQVSVTGMQFVSNGYRLQGDAIALSGSRATIRVGDGSSAGAGYTATISNALTGTAQLEKTDAGTLVLTGTNTYSGGTRVSGGTLVGGIRSFGTGAIENHGALVINEASDGVFSNTLSGDGSLSKTGLGLVRYDGDGSAFTGSLAVDGGAFSVNGTLGGHMLIGNGGILKGTGTVGSTTLAAGATAAPGNSIGTLRVAGNLVFQAGSAYEVEVDAAGNGDRIDVTGTATLGGATVKVLAANGSWNTVTRYTILSAAGGVLGTFGTLTSSLAFLTPSLAYDAQKVTLTLARNDVTFLQVGTSANQGSTGQAIEQLGAGSVYDAVLQADAATARTAFDRLSGEVHATVRSGLIEDSRFVRDATLARLQQDGDSTLAANDLRASQDAAGNGVWARAYDGHGRAAGDGNAARADRSASGVLVGADRRVGDWRVGVMGGAGHDKTDVPERDSHASIDSYHVGAYGGRRWGDLALRTGISYTRHDIDTRRNIAFSGFTDSARADYHADTAQAYGELGWQLKAGSVELEPFAGLAHVRLHTDSFDERGGFAALQGRSDTTGTTFSTLGLRAGQRFGLGPFQMTARGMLGWQRAYGDVTSQASLAFDGGSAFPVSGVPVARNMLVAEAGVDVQLQRFLTLGLAYAGQRGDGVHSHSVKADLRWRF